MKKEERKRIIFTEDRKGHEDNPFEGIHRMVLNELFVGFDVVRDDSQLDGLQLVGALIGGSHLRGARVFAVGGLGTPVRLEIGPEIGPYQALAERRGLLRRIR
jgi:hypothetical protein